ncbi:matrix metallopeptidase-21 [Neolamprologus brichardi]|uniref:matrix metallopeptidase-21 n=1 Tax=Neolamprologus brichardi TaxID=32507 RepID=UPI00164396F9|nr:matrix metallopeptidase-21 [Neolamprologus brichardi]
MLNLIQLIFMFFLTNISTTDAEKLFHNRDHSDTQTLNSHKAQAITDKYTAELFLSRYGFIKPVNWEEVRFEDSDTSFSGDFLDDLQATIQEGTSASYSRAAHRAADQQGYNRQNENQAFISALKEFQRVSGLPVTGVFDEATKLAMNKPRCGVPDKETAISNDTSVNYTTELLKITSLNSSHDSRPGSQTGNTSANAHQSETVRRKKENLASLISKSRRKRDLTPTGHMAFSKKVLNWRLIGEGYSSQLTIDDQRYIFRLAFRMWSEVSPLEFVEDTHAPLEDVDIRLGFGTGRHLGCNQKFDGTGQEFAHAWFLGDIHFDDDEHFTTPNVGSGISLLKVAVHEIGHVLGLPHIYRPGSIMQPSYLPQESSFEMDWMDRKAIQQLYGGCKGRFNAVFDWIRKEKTPYGEVVIRFNTYFMRDGWYWLYENRNNRTRYGDPVPLQTGWHGIPMDGVDAHVHVWSRKRDAVYFFRGAQFWRYDSENDQVFGQDSEGHHYPRLISEGFPGVPSPIDTAFYDRRDSHIYFFKNNLVYAFSVEANNLARGSPKNIRDVFPPVVNTDHPDGNIDAAYFSYTHNAIFLLKGIRFWQVVGSRDRRRRPFLPRNGLLPHKEVDQHWFDICNVHPTALKLTR